MKRPATAEKIGPEVAEDGPIPVAKKPTAVPAPRGSLFISHAVEDNDFALWLGSRLSAAGFDVWADVLRLKGGDDWSRVLEDALRNKASKMIWVASQKGTEKQGVRNEIQIATDVAKKLNDESFIIPVKLEPCEAPFLAVHHQWVDFRSGWGAGLTELLENLSTIEGLTKSAGLNADSMGRWLAAQGAKKGSLKQETEVLVSNWLPLKQVPATIRYFAFFGAGADEQAAAAVATYKLPAAKYGSGFFGFGNADDFGAAPSGIAPRLTQEIPIDDFLSDGVPLLGLQQREARNMYSNLLRVSLERWLVSRGLSDYEFSARTHGYWAAASLFKTKERIPFDWKNGWKGSRTLTGEVTRGLKKYRWHYGVTAYVRVDGETHIQLTPRIIFTENGTNPLDTAKKMHALRRSIPRGWRNDRWRDLMLAFLFWLSEGKEHIDIPVGIDRVVCIGAMPLTMQSPVSITSPNDEKEDGIEEEDPVFEAELNVGYADGEDDEA